MTSLKALQVVAEALRARGLNVVEDEVWSGSIGLFVGEQLLCRTVPEGIQIQHVLVFDGHAHVVPDDCDTAIVSPPAAGRPWWTDFLVYEVLRRMDVRATSLPLPPCTLRDPRDIAAEVERSLAPKGICGTFVVAPGPAADTFAWHGERGDRYDAERALVLVLEADGHAAERILGLGVRVMHLVSVHDHEAAMHNAEPPEALVVECETDAAFVERYDGEIDTAAE